MMNTELIQIIIKNEKRIKLSLSEITDMINQIQINDKNVDKVIDEIFSQIEEKIYNIFVYIFIDANLETHYTIQKYFQIEYDVNKINKEEVLKKIKENFLRSNIGKRLQFQKKKLKQNIDKLVNATDESSLDDLKKKCLSTAKFNLRRLMATEGNRIINESVVKAIEDKDFVKQVIFIATLDKKTSKICRSMDGKIINKEDLVLGVNKPPLHPFCRSIISIYEDGLIKNRIERDIKSGKSRMMGEYLTFEEWKKKNNLY